MIVSFLHLHLLEDCYKALRTTSIPRPCSIARWRSSSAYARSNRILEWLGMGTVKRSTSHWETNNSWLSSIIQWKVSIIHKLIFFWGDWFLGFLVYGTIGVGAHESDGSRRVTGSKHQNCSISISRFPRQITMRLWNIITTSHNHH